jgi:hypothetical protein
LVVLLYAEELPDAGGELLHARVTKRFGRCEPAAWLREGGDNSLGSGTSYGWSTRWHGRVWSFNSLATSSRKAEMVAARSTRAINLGDDCWPRKTNRTHRSRLVLREPFFSFYLRHFHVCRIDYQVDWRIK